MTTVTLLPLAQQRLIAAAAEEVNLARGHLDYTLEFWGNLSGHPGYNRERRDLQVGAAQLRLTLAEIALLHARGDIPRPPRPIMPLPRRRMVAP